jgi:hypothetical protein
LTHSNLFALELLVVVLITERLLLWLPIRATQLLEVPEVYNTMSPFMNADKTPLLLVHGEADNNLEHSLCKPSYFQALSLGSTGKNGYLT